MKVILQHAGQSAEYEVLGRDGIPLTNQQAVALINLATANMVKITDLPEGATTLQKAAALARAIGERLTHVAREQRRSQLAQDAEATIATELG